MPKVIIGVYEQPSTARQVVEALLGADVAQEAVSIIGGDAGETTSKGPLGPFTSGAGLVQRLAGMDIAREDAEAYAEAQRRGYGLVIVDARDTDPARICGILEQEETVDVDRRVQKWREQGWRGFESTARTFSSDQINEEIAQFGSAAAETMAQSAEQITQSASETTERMEQVMSGNEEQQWKKQSDKGQGESRQQGERQQPSGDQAREQETQMVQEVEEKVNIGKREVRGGGARVHASTEERPVEEKLQLREEQVKVERHDADRKLSPEEAERAFQERTVEVEEVSERPMVSKETRVVGEVEIGKEVHQREETVRDKERRTRIDVEQKEPVESH